MTKERVFNLSDLEAQHRAITGDETALRKFIEQRAKLYPDLYGENSSHEPASNAAS